jgi:hypothetical protein
VAKKRSRLPRLQAFGQRLRELRGDRSRQQISLKLQRLNADLDESSLFQYEAGTVWAPDVAALQGLCEIYGVQLSEMVSLLRANRAKTSATDWRDLLRHGSDQRSTSHQGGSGVSASDERTRILDLERKLKAYEVALDSLQDVQMRLAKIAAVRKQDGSSEEAAPRPGRRRRAAG